MSRAERIEELVGRYVEFRDQGAVSDPETFASEHPDLRDELLAALRSLAGVEDLLAPPEGMDPLPETFDRFRVLAEIGRGGMAQVLAVEDPLRPGTPLALKLLDPLRERDARARRRLQREAQSLGSLSHPGIVRVVEVGLAGARPFVVMERVAGRTLAERLDEARARGAAAPDLPGDGSPHHRAARIVASLARATAALHAAGLLHRDLKPANAIVTPSGRAVLIDFGLVGCSDESTLTRTGDVLGTPQYMAPEQARGEDLDERADVYGLGAVLYELLSLVPPHSGADRFSVLERVRTRPVRALRRLRGDLPRELSAIAARALAHHRRFRTPSAAQLAEELEAFAAGRSVPASSTLALETLAGLWTFHRRPLATAFALACAPFVLFVFLELRQSKRAAETAALRDEAVLAWVERDAERSGRLAKDTLERDPQEVSAAMLLALLSDDAAPAGGLPAGFSEALARQQAGDQRGALPDWRRAAAAAPGSAVPVVLAARAASRLEELDEAARQFAAAVTLVPRSPRLHMEYADVLYRRGVFEAARQQVEEALALAPEKAAAWELAARCRTRLGDRQGALEAARRAYELAGEDAPNSVLNTYAVMLEQEGRAEEGRAVLERLLERERERATEPDAQRSNAGSRARAEYNLAFSFDKEHRAVEAAQAYWRAVEEGDGARSLAALAWLYAGAKRESCEGCKRVYEEHPYLLDAERAESCALAALDHDGGAQASIVQTVALVARRIARTERIRARLRELQDAASEDRRLANLTRGLRQLDRP